MKIDKIEINFTKTILKTGLLVLYFEFLLTVSTPMQLLSFCVYQMRILT